MLFPMCSFRRQKLLLHNSFSVPVPLSLSIRHQSFSPFQVSFKRRNAILITNFFLSQLEQREVTLPARQETAIMISFFPFTKSVSIDTLDIYDRLHAKQYRVRRPRPPIIRNTV